MVACVNGGNSEGRIACSGREVPSPSADQNSTGIEGRCSTRTTCGSAPSTAYKQGLNNGRKSRMESESAAV
jgi:hypothetical protein